MTHHNMHIRHRAAEKDLMRLHRPMNIRRKIRFIFGR